jgi:hypothetical protein
MVVAAPVGLSSWSNGQSAYSRLLTNHHSPLTLHCAYAIVTFLSKYTS